MGTAEAASYPLTGRFLQGRLRDSMTREEKALVESLVETTERYTEPTRLISCGEAAERSTIVVEGYLMRVIADGDQRFIVGLQVPGDFADLHGFALPRLDHDIVTLGDTLVGFVPHSRLREVLEDHPRLARLLWFASLIDAAIHRQWILKMEQLTAPRRVAHIFAELWYRLDLVGLGRRDGLRTPLTQSDLADMCGTTAIHMNRALGVLKREGVAEFRRGTVYVPDRGRLESFARFDPDYLYGKESIRNGAPSTRR
ncbi:MAG TPA: Crp/Fnr family transcriptional regulator [Croceibacterium sp.]|nr:Crp/Fnr family transcriptional regulator [Croceibacterium sp.]